MERAIVCLFVVMVLLSLSLAACALTTAPTDTPEPMATVSADAELTARLGGFANMFSFDGILLVWRNGDAVLDKGHGMAKWEKLTPLATDPRFHLADLTIPLTVTALLLLPWSATWHQNGQGGYKGERRRAH
jgi:CubicO group peptidase (beta-lactamase class C family)